MCQISLNIPDGILYNMCMTQLEATENFKRIIAFYCFNNGGGSFEECAKIAEMPKKDFIRYIIENKEKLNVSSVEEESPFEALRKDGANLPEMTLGEINEEINAVRMEMERG